MMKRKRMPLLFMSAMVLAAFLLAGCSIGPSPADAQNYVKAMLDIICTGDYDHSMKFADIEEGQESQMRDEMIDLAVSQMDEAYGGLTDQEKTEYRDFLDEAFRKCRYSVGEAVKTDDGGYDVTVTVEPLRVYAGLDNPTYDDPVDVIVHYGILDKEKGYYGLNEEEGARLGEHFFSTETE